MKRWPPRIFWVSAWSFWLWLGIGLQRELPRNLGRVVCKLPLGPGETVKDFVRFGPSVVTKQHDSSIGKDVFRRRSARTGEVELTISVQRPVAENWIDFASCWVGYIVGNEDTRYLDGLTPATRGYVIDPATGEVRLYNLRTGERRDYSDLGSLVGVHWERPWMLFVRFKLGEGNERVTVLDAETGKRVFEFPIPAGAFQRNWLPRFVGDNVALSFVEGDERCRLEIRSTTDGTLVGTIRDLGSFWSSTADGKVAQTHHSNSSVRVEVHDARTEELLLADETPAPQSVDGSFYVPAFSRDGRYFLSPPTGALFDLAASARIWKAAPHERASLLVSPGRFEIVEDWMIGWRSWSTIVRTHVIRNLADRSFVCRTWNSIASPVDESRTMIIVDDSIRRLPPRVSWPLLALCQAILALPPVLLWAGLRWRGKSKS